MKTFSQFITEVYDKDVMGSSQIKKTGEGGRIGAERKKSTPERRRMKAVGGGKMEPVEYKDRKDIGQQRQRSTSCLLYTSPSPRDATLSRMPSSA